MSHDQNFKNLILDYPREAVHFFAAAEAMQVDQGARILPIRSENMIFTNSFSAISVVINALATAVVARTKGRAVTTLKAVNAMLVESGHYTDQPSPRWQEPQ